MFYTRIYQNEIAKRAQSINGALEKKKKKKKKKVDKNTDIQKRALSALENKKKKKRKKKRGRQKIRTFRRGTEL